MEINYERQCRILQMRIDDMKIEAMTRDFILNICKGKTVDPMGVSISINDRWGLHVDWHIVSNILEKMVFDGRAAYAGFTLEGCHKYTIFI